MKFERAKTEKSKKRLKKVFYFTFFIWLSAGILRLLKSGGNLDIAFVSSILNVLSVLGFIALFVVYIIHIFVEGLEKPKFKPTKTHNKVKNESASKAGPDAAKTRRPF